MPLRIPGTTEHEAPSARSDGDLKGLVSICGRILEPLSEGVGVADKFLKEGSVVVSHHGRSSPENDMSRPRQRGKNIAGGAGQSRPARSRIVAGAIKITIAA